MADQTYSKPKSGGFNLTTAILLLLPLIVLGGVIVLFLNTSGGLQLKSWSASGRPNSPGIMESRSTG